MRDSREGGFESYLSLEELMDETRPVKVAIPVLKEGQERFLHFRYKPNAFTPELEEITRNPESGELEMDTPTVMKMLAHLIDSWSLTEKRVEAGGKTKVAPLPVNEETLRRIPRKLLWQMLAAIGEDQGPNDSSDATSSSGTSSEVAS